MTQHTTHEHRRRIMRAIALIIALISGYLFLVSFAAYYVYDAINSGTVCGCVVPVPAMIMILSSLGLFIGGASYYLMAIHLSREERHHRAGLAKALRFLAPEERKVVEALAKAKAPTRQRDLERATSIHRVQIHRIVRRLESRGIVETRREGRVSVVRLDDDLARLL